MTYSRRPSIEHFPKGSITYLIEYFSKIEIKQLNHFRLSPSNSSKLHQMSSFPHTKSNIITFNVRPMSLLYHLTYATLSPTLKSMQTVNVRLSRGWRLEGAIDSPILTVLTIQQQQSQGRI